MLIFSRVRSEKDHHAVVVFLITNDSPASSKLPETDKENTGLSPSLSVPQNRSPAASFSLLMWELPGEMWFYSYSSKRKQPHLVSRMDGVPIVAHWEMHEDDTPPKFNQDVITAPSPPQNRAGTTPTYETEHTRACSCILVAPNWNIMSDWGGFGSTLVFSSLRPLSLRNICFTRTGVPETRRLTWNTHRMMLTGRVNIILECRCEE